MRPLFVIDTLISFALLVIISYHSYEWTNSAYPIAGASVHAACRFVFNFSTLANWSEFSNDNWYLTLSKKKYHIELPLCALLSFVCFFAGSFLWHFFYLLSFLFALWAISQLTEAISLLIYKYIIRHI